MSAFLSTPLNLLKSCKRNDFRKFLIAGFAVVLVTALTGTAPADAVVKPTASSSCGQVNLIGLAGSGELDSKSTAGTDSMGQVVTDLSNNLKKAYAGTGITYTAHGIKYRAISVPDAVLAYPTNPKAYDTSELDGQVRLQSYINKFVLTCPGQIVLAGYSQGAQAVLSAYALLGPLQSRVSGVALFGDPLFNPGLSPMDQGSFSQSALSGSPLPYVGRGILGVRGDPGPLQSKSRSFCLFGDPICNSPSDIKTTLACVNFCNELNAITNCGIAVTNPALSGLCPHLQYRNGSTLAAADFIRSTVPPLDHITVAPGQASIKPGDSQVYKVTGFDAQNNSLGDRTLTSLFSIAPDGSCFIGSCTATTPGIHTVTVTSGGKSASATLIVQPTYQHKGDLVYEVDASDVGRSIWIRHAADGTTAKIRDGYSPDISPDGSKIVYNAPDPNIGSAITWVMNADGTNPVALDPEGQTTSYYDSAPRWSPDGTKICITRNYAWDQGGYNGNGYLDMFILSADGQSLTGVTSDHQSSGPVSWSPDGTRLVYSSIPFGLAVINLDGSNKHLLFPDGDYRQLYDPDWSPAGDRIYVDTNIAGIQYVTSTDGFTTPVTDTAHQLMPGTIYRDYYPRVSGDGSTVVFAGFDRCLDGTKTCYTFNLFEVSSAGGQPTLLSGTTGGYAPSLVK